MAENLLALLPCLIEMERKLIADAMYDHDKRNYTDLRAIALLNRTRVTAALRKFYKVYGTIAARHLAYKLRKGCKAG
jgi:hypothetical protein